MRGFTDARGVGHPWDGTTPVAWRVSIYAVAVRDGHLLAMEPGYAPGLWELSGGGVRPRETLDAALAREVYEETGYAVLAVDGAPVFVAEQAFFLAGDPDGEASAFRHSVLFAARVQVAETPAPTWRPLKGETIQVARLPLADVAPRLRPLHQQMFAAIGLM